MRILAIDMGTGTQDILLFDSTRPVENSTKMVMPSATKIAEGRIRRATAAAQPLLLSGVIQGGGPCNWAIEDHLRAGGVAYATPDAAQTLDDDLEQVARMGVRIVSDDETKRLGKDVHRVELKDLDLPAIRAALAAFDVSPEFDGLALACLDHGAAPPGYSDRLFRFDHLKRIVGARNDLAAFAFLPEELPDYLTRARAMMDTAHAQDPDDAGRLSRYGPRRRHRRAAGSARRRRRDPTRAEPRQHARARLPPPRHPHHQPLRAPHRRALPRADRRLHRAPDRRHAPARGRLQHARATASSTRTAKVAPQRRGTATRSSPSPARSAARSATAASTPTSPPRTAT